MSLHIKLPPRKTIVKRPPLPRGVKKFFHKVGVFNKQAVYTRK